MSQGIHSVLAAVDFGDASARAVTAAGLIVERCGAETFRLLHAEAVDAPPYFTHDQLDALEQQRRQTRAQAEQFLVRFGRQHTHVPFVTILDDRPPVDAILNYALAADLVVLGTHGRRGPMRWWLGSVAERVLRHVTRPLLIVPAHAAPVSAAIGRRVLVHAAPPLAGTRSADVAHYLASCFQGDVVDGRGGAPGTAIDRADASLLVVAAPVPATSAWLSGHGEPLVRSSEVPMLFVPEIIEGAVL